MTRLKLIVAGALLAGTFALYLPVLRFDFVDFDDNLYVTENSRVQQGLSVANVGWAFGGSHAAFWHPLAWLSHMLDCQIFGLNPAGHHFTALLLHAANALLLFFVLQRMTGVL